MRPRELRFSPRSQSVFRYERAPLMKAHAVTGYVPQRAGMSPAQYAICLGGVVRREALRWLKQRGRFISALVRPLVWLAIFAAGFHFVLGVSIIPPYETYIPYEVYIAPGLLAMIQLFNGMQSSLSMVYDREMGSMKTLMISPFPRWFLLIAKLLAGVAVSVVQAYIFLAIAWFWDIQPPITGYFAVLPALVLSGLMLGALGLVLSSFVEPVGELRRRDELRDFPDVLHLLGALSAVAGEGGEPGRLVDLRNQPVHPRGRTDPLRHVRQVQRPVGGGRARVSAGVHGARGDRLRPGPRFDGAAGGRRMRASAGAVLVLLAAGAAAFTTVSAGAAPPWQTPDWPCPQRLVPELTAGTFWNGPPAPAGANWRDDPKIANLVGAVAPRDVPVAEGEKKLATFADSLSPEQRRKVLPELFAALVDAVNDQRHTVIVDLKQLDRRQKSVAALVNKVADEENGVPADAIGAAAARRDEIEQRRDFLIRMFQQTQQTIRYACRVPSEMEARLGRYARVLQAKL